MRPDIARKKFTTRDYHKMAGAGILAQRDRVELIDGEIVEMSPIGPAHAAATNRADKLFTRSFGEDALVRVQQPLVIGDWSEPEPDVSVVRIRKDFYADRHPVPGDVFFLIEISDTTIEFDRTVKLQLYAAARVSEFWILDLTARRLDVHRDPAGDVYKSIRSFKPSDRVGPALLPAHTFDVGDLLP